MAKCSPEEIRQAVERQREADQSRRDRMDEDYDRWRLVPYDEGEAGKGFATYTSPELANFADKIISWQTQASMVLRIPPMGGIRNSRENDSTKERFILGLLKAADEDLDSRMLPRIREQLAWFVTLRGWYAGRALLVKPLPQNGEDSSTYVDITPWDPRHTYWGMGKRGLSWICYVIKKTATQIEEEYGVAVELATTEDPMQGIDVYDYYDEENNIVCTDSEMLKPPTPHGSPRVPGFIGYVGANPLIQSPSSSDAIRDVGESVYRTIRGIMENYHQMLSIMMEFAKRGRKNPLVITSPDGSITLDENPWLEGSDISLPAGTNIEPLDLMKSAPDLMPFLALISGDVQRSGLPHSVYGELQFQLSGYAITTLRKGIETVLLPRIAALERAYIQITRLLVDQYLTNAFPAMELSGLDNDRKYFKEDITPGQIRKAGDAEIKLVAVLPQDDQTRMAMAQMAREGPTPLIDDRNIREMYLALQDPDRIEDAVKEQMGERMLPEAALLSILNAMINSGKQEEAWFYYMQLTQLLAEKYGAMGQAGAPGGQPGAQGPQPGAPGAQPGAPGAQPGAPPGGPGGVPGNGRVPGQAGPTLPPQVLPNAAMGVPPPFPTPQAGPNVPPGSPRPAAQATPRAPGALSTAERLRLLGLSQ